MGGIYQVFGRWKARVLNVVDVLSVYDPRI